MMVSRSCCTHDGTSMANCSTPNESARHANDIGAESQGQELDSMTSGRGRKPSPAAPSTTRWKEQRSVEKPSADARWRNFSERPAVVIAAAAISG